MTDQPFTVEVLDARRTVSNTLLVRFAVTNHGSRTDAARARFFREQQPRGRQHDFLALRRRSQRADEISRCCAMPKAARSVPGSCWRLKPGERGARSTRNFSRRRTLPVPCKIVSSPKADADSKHVPIGLPQAGEPIPSEAAIGDPGSASRSRRQPVPIAPSSANDQPNSNNQPNVYTNQTQLVGSGSTAEGHRFQIESANATVPFTIEGAQISRRTPTGATLRLGVHQ